MDLEDLIKNAVIEASTKFREDQLNAYKQAINNETNPNAKWVLELLLKNAEIASSTSFPLCDDTGIPHVLLEIGTEVQLPAGFFESINLGIASGLKELPGRPMAVKGDPVERIEQSRGLYNQPEKVKTPSFIVDTMKEDGSNIHIFMLRWGPEIRAHTYKVFHKRNHRKVFEEVINMVEIRDYNARMHTLHSI